MDSVSYPSDNPVGGVAYFYFLSLTVPAPKSWTNHDDVAFRLNHFSGIFFNGLFLLGQGLAGDGKGYLSAPLEELEVP